jgi:hypothetical protein
VLLVPVFISIFSLRHLLNCFLLSIKSLHEEKEVNCICTISYTCIFFLSFPFTIVQKITQRDALIDLFKNWHTIGLRSLHLYVMGTKTIMLQDRGLLCFALNVYKKGASVTINSVPINIFLFYNYPLCNSPRRN